MVFTASMSARRVRRRFGVYSATKAALLTTMQHYANELGRDGIRCNAIVPGYIWGPNLEAWFAYQAQQRGVDPEVVYDEVASETALHHLPTSEEVADAAVFLASDLSRAITGVGLDVNAGTGSTDPRLGQPADAPRHRDSPQRPVRPQPWRRSSSARSSTARTSRSRRSLSSMATRPRSAAARRRSAASSSARTSADRRRRWAWSVGIVISPSLAGKEAYARQRRLHQSRGGRHPNQGRRPAVRGSQVPCATFGTKLSMSVVGSSTVSPSSADR